MSKKRYYIGNGENCTICDSNQGGSDFYNMLTQFEAVDRLNEQEETIQRLKRTMKGVAELLSEEVDLFSDKATEHDINAYIELKELDNKDAYYMAVSTKKAIKMLKGDVE